MQQEKIRLSLSAQKRPQIRLTDMPDFMRGSVWLAGAGPGDIGLLTLLCAHAIQHADVLVYDALVSEDILSLAPSKAQIIYAGKRGGKPSAVQADISEQLVYHARANKRVLRLKGGDPFIFGRGGEEAEALVKAGISIRIIPGVSAAQGASAYAGVPLTHRLVNHVVSFVTGHRAGDIDWGALARGSPVIVVYMGLRQLVVISEQLIAGGCDVAMPLAIITHATTPQQRVFTMTLGEAVRGVSDLEPPALIIIGETVAFHAVLDWFSSSSDVAGVAR